MCSIKETRIRHREEFITHCHNSTKRINNVQNPSSVQLFPFFVLFLRDCKQFCCIMNHRFSCYMSVGIEDHYEFLSKAIIIQGGEWTFLGLPPSPQILWSKQLFRWPRNIILYQSHPFLLSLEPQYKYFTMRLRSEEYNYIISSSFCYADCLPSKYSPHHFVVKHTQSEFFSWNEI
jgi:hypothetical protein